MTVSALPVAHAFALHKGGSIEMDAMVEGCAGLDVHQRTVVACVLSGRAGEKPRQLIRTFGTFTHELSALRDWLLSEGCTHVGMESTGVYWMPVYAILEGHFELIVGNAQHIKRVPGRKTDVKDAEWIADLVRHGLIAKSFVPDAGLRELRDLLRYRRKLVESRTGERNRLLKLLEQANIKLASVATDVFGVSGMLMLKQLVEGDATPAEMAQLAKARLRNKRAELEVALEGRVREHHRFILQMQIHRLEQLDGDIAALEQRIDEKLEPYREQHARVRQIPGVDWLVGAVLIAELGVEMSVFESAGRLASWVGVCPGNYESAGKQKSGRISKGNHYVKTELIEAAHAASRAKGTYLKEKFYRLKARRGYQRAIVAIAHKILVSAFHILATQDTYKELGAAYLDRIDQQRVAANLVRRLEQMGYEVEVRLKAA